MRAAVCRFAPGRYLHIIQVPTTFDQFPELGFGSVRALSEEANKVIADDVARFWRFLQSQSDHRSSVTVLLLSGWGTPHSLSPPIAESTVQAGWHYLTLSFADAAVLGACENGKFRDVLRILGQVERLEADGFSFQNVNGILNLFGFWRTTDGNLIPEHMWKITPPSYLMMPTDELLTPRMEAAKKRDFRSLQLPTGEFKVVQRLDWDDVDGLRPIYASIIDAVERRLLGAVFIDDRTWWVECVTVSGAERDWQFRFWQAVLNWLAAVGRDVIASFPHSFPPGAVRITISIPDGLDFEKGNLSSLSNDDLQGSISSSGNTGSGLRKVEVGPGWMAHLSKAENDAEIELIAAILEQLLDQQGVAVSRKQLGQATLDSIGSRDWRWLHAREALTPIDRLRRAGLIGRFRKMALSAWTLVKCGSIWDFRTREKGLEINGEDECRDFLAGYRDCMLNGLIAQIQMMDRVKLMTLAAEQYQAARSQQQHWRGTIKALRAIHGTSADKDAFTQENAINGVQRAAKAICEIAACEAACANGLDPGQMDFEEMSARALLLFSNGQLFASIRAGIVKPELRISPAGDLLSDRSVLGTAFKPGAEWTNKRALDEAANTYGRNPSQGEAGDGKLSIDQGLRSAIEAEYGVPAEAFVDLQYAVLQIAEYEDKGVFVKRRSELSALLAKNENYPSDDPIALLRRLTLNLRPSWRETSAGMTKSDIDQSRFDRPYSIINRPLVAMDDDADPLVLIAPLFVSDSTMYSLSGLMNGNLNNQFWTSVEAKKFAGMKGRASGDEFEERVVEKVRGLGLKAWPRCKLSWALNEKVDDELGDVDVLAVSIDGQRVWVIEAKNLRLCRTEAEVAARLSEYRGRMTYDSKGREKPDRMLRHVRRVQYLRQRRDHLCARLGLDTIPEVRGLLVVDAPQPMNFHMIEHLPDGDSAFLDAISSWHF